MNEIKKPNDIFVATLLNPNVSNLDLIQADINPENTGFLSMDDYKESKFVQESFTKDGKFDNIAFEQAYIMAAKKYEDFTDEDFYKNLEKEVEYNDLDIFRPMGSKTLDLSPELTVINDPFKSKRGLSSMRSVTSSDLSIRELAQQSKIWDNKTNKWLDKSPNDLGFFGNLMKDPLVYAQWDEDGIHVDSLTGATIRHKKGEYKVNDSGNFYTETLGDREIYGKQVVSSFDVITRDNSVFNQFDFLDSDGKEKSAWGTTFKLASQIAPFLIPKVAPIWGGITAAFGLASVMPVVYKSFEGLLGITDESGYENQTDLFKTMSKAEGFFGKLNQSHSDASSDSMFNYETIGGMVGDVFSQIYQQRAAASLSKLFKYNNLNKIEADEVAKFQAKFQNQLLAATEKGLVKDPIKFWKESVNLNPAMKAIAKRQSELSKSLSLGYMALTSASDVYEEAIKAGYDRHAAGLAFTASSAAMYGLMMNNGMGDWFLDKTTGYSVEQNKALMRKALKPYIDDLQKGVSLINTNKNAGKKSIASTFEKIKKSTQDTFLGAIDGSESLWKNSIVESVEETSEEAVMDAIKGGMDFLSSLGVFRSKGDFQMKENFLSKETLQRYLTSAVGGFVGGALFEANTKYIEPALNPKLIKPQEEYSLINKIANGETEILIDEVRKMRKRLGNKYLSPVTITLQGQEVSVGNDGENSEGDIIADRLINHIKYLDGILNQEGLKIKDEDLFQKALLNQYMIPQIENSGVDKFILSDFNKLASDIHRLHAEIKSADTAKNEELSSKLNSDLKLKRDEINAILNGEKAITYLEQGLFSLIKDIHKPFISLDKLAFTKAKYDSDYMSLPETGILSKESVSKEFDEYKKDPNIVKNLNIALAGFKEMQKLFSPTIENYTTSKYKDIRRKVFKTLLNSGENFSLYEELSKDVKSDDSMAKQISNAAEKGGDNNFTLTDIIGVNIFESLKNDLDLSKFTPEETQLIEQLFQEINLKSTPLQTLSVDTLKNLVNLVNEKLQKHFESLGQEIKLIETDNIKSGIYNNLLVSYLLENSDLEVDNEILIKVKDQLTKNFNTDLLYDIDTEMLFGIGGDLNLNSIEGLELTPELLKELNIFSSKGFEQEFKNQIDSGNSYIQALENTINKRNDLSKQIYESYKNSSIYDELFGDYYFNEVLPLTLDSFDKTLIENYKKFDEIVETKKVYKNPLLETLRNFTLNLDENTKTTIFDLMMEESNLLEKSSIEKYIKDGVSYEMIKLGIDAVEAINAVVMGMYVKQSEGSPFGFNHAIKNYLDKYENGKDSDKYAILEEEDTIEIVKELNLIREKLQFLLDLSDSNNISKVKEDNEIRETHTKIILKHLENLTDKFIFKGKPLIANKEEIINKPGITPEHKRMLLEEAIFNFVDKLNADEKLEFYEQLFSTINLDEAVNGQPENLRKSMTKISEFDWMIYLTSIISLNSRDFNERLLTIIDSEEYKLAPLYSQEYSAKLQYSFAKNQKIYDILELKLKSHVKDSSHVLLHVATVLGIGGSGKTTAVGNLVLKLLAQDGNVNIIVSGPSDSQVNSLNTALFQNLNADEKKAVTSNKLNKQELFDFFYTYNDGSFYNKFNRQNPKVKDTDLNGIVVERTTESGSLVFDVAFKQEYFKKLTDFPKYIFIDEISHFNALELQLLNEISKHFGVVVFTYGDDSQMGATTPFTEGDYNLNFIIGMSPPKLELSLRASNTHNKTNAVQLMNISRRVNNAYDSLKEIEEAQKAVTDIIRNNPVNLNYSEKNNELSGAKVVNELLDTDLDLLVNNVNRLSDGSIKSKLGIVNLNGEIDNDLKKKLIDKGLKDEDILFYSIKNNTKNPIQGKEHNFILFSGVSNEDLKTETLLKEPHTLYKTIYTVLSRSLEGTVYINSNNHLGDLNITNTLKQHNPVEQINDDLINLAKNDRKNVLSLLTNNKRFEKQKAKTPTKENITKNDKKVIELKDSGVAPQNEILTETDLKNLIENDEDPSKLDSLEDDFEEEITHSIDKVNKTKELIQLSDRTFKYMFHPFYNRLGVEKSNSGYTKVKGNFDAQNITSSKISDTDIKNFIDLKNRIVYYLNDPEGLKKSLSNSKIKDFIEKKTNLGTVEDIVSAVSNNEFILSAKNYNEAIDKPAFKYELDSSKLDDKILLSYVLKIKSNNTFKYITLGVMSDPITYENFAKKEISKIDNTVKDRDALIQEFNQSTKSYKDLFNKFEQDLQNKEFVNYKISDVDKNNLLIFTSGLRLVSANKTIAEVKAGMKNKISANELEKEIPGLKIHYPKVLTKKNQPVINIFKGTSADNYADILNVLKKHGLGEKSLESYTTPDENGRFSKLEALNNKSYLIITLTDEYNESFSKILLLTPKSRNFKTVLKEFGIIKEGIVNQGKHASEFNSLISKPDGAKLFFQMKQNILKSPKNTTAENEMIWETLLFNLNRMVDEIYKPKDTDDSSKKNSKSTLAKHAKQKITLINKLNSWEEFKEKAKILNSDYANLYIDPIFNIGKEIIQLAYDVQEDLTDENRLVANWDDIELDGEILQKIKAFYSPTTFLNFMTEAANFDSEGNPKEYYYNTKFANVGNITKEDSKQFFMEKADLKNFELSVVPEMQRAVINLKDTLENGLIEDSESLTPPVVETVVETETETENIVEVVEETIEDPFKNLIQLTANNIKGIDPILLDDKLIKISNKMTEEITLESLANMNEYEELIDSLEEIGLELNQNLINEFKEDFFPKVLENAVQSGGVIDLTTNSINDFRKITRASNQLGTTSPKYDVFASYFLNPINQC